MSLPSTAIIQTFLNKMSREDPEHIPDEWKKKLHMIPLDLGPVKYHSFLRPEVLEFLKMLADNAASVSIWSAGQPAYIHDLVPKLSAWAGVTFTFVWAADQCDVAPLVSDDGHILPGETFFCKPLNKIIQEGKKHGLDMSEDNTILIDDNIYHKTMKNTHHGVYLIPAFEGNPEDNELPIVFFRIMKFISQKKVPIHVILDVDNTLVQTIDVSKDTKIMNHMSPHKTEEKESSSRKTTRKKRTTLSPKKTSSSTTPASSAPSLLTPRKKTTKSAPETAQRFVPLPSLSPSLASTVRPTSPFLNTPSLTPTTLPPSSQKTVALRSPRRSKK